MIIIYFLLIIVYLLLIIVYSLFIIVYSLLISVYSLLIIFYSLLISVYSLLFIFNSLLIIVCSLLIFFCAFLIIVYSITYFVRYPWPRGRGENWCSKGHEFVPTLRTLSLFSQEKSLEISGNYGKIRLITENFGTLGNKFPDNIWQSFPPPLTVWPGTIRSKRRNSA